MTGIQHRNIPMNITANAASLNWRTNNHGVWKALVKDMAPNSSVTFSDGLTGTAAGRQVTVESPSMPTGFMTYTTDDNTAVFGGVLYGAGMASDSLEAVGGEKTVRMGSVDLGTLEWNPYEEPSEQRPYGRTVASIPDRNSGTVNLVCSDYTAKYDNQANKVVYGNPSSTQIILIDSSLAGKTGVEIQAALSGVILYYELATPTTSTETAQSLALQTGVNNLALNERDPSFTLYYTGTEFTLPLDSTHKYAFSDNGVKSMLTGSSEQAVTGGQDMLVDVTRMFNGDTAAINAVTSWADMAAVMPAYLSNVAYNEGEVVGRSGGVTTTSGGSATFSNLHGVGTAKDTQDVVTGAKTVKMGSVDLGTLNWNKYFNLDHTFYVSFPEGVGTQTGVQANIICDKYKAVTTGAAVLLPNLCIQLATNLAIHDDSYSDAVLFKAAMSGVILYYELAEPTTFSETPQSLIAVNGLNNVHEQNMSITGTPLTMGYTGTDQTIPTETTSKYLARIDGVDSVVENVESIDVRGGRDRVIDLTYMFGEGSEPATAADFYKLFPTWLGYAIPYNKGSLVNFKGTGLKSVGFNLLNVEGRTLGVPSNTGVNKPRGVFDETKYYVGFTVDNVYYNPSNVTEYSLSNSQISVKTTSVSYGVAIPIRVIPGRTYRFENSPKPRLSFYTYDGTYISYSSSQSSVVPANAYWGIVLVTSVTANVTSTWTNPCVHLQWSGGRNGQYEPYWDYTRPLPTLTYFEQGMNGRGTVRDEITQRQAVTRLAEVDMEDLEWTESSGSWTATLSGMKSNTTAIVAENGLKPVVSGTTVTIQSAESPTGKLVYELANPSTVTFPEEVNTTAQVSDYGTESVVPVNGYELVTAPFLGIVKYQDNYARTITKLPENYQSQESMDALQLVLGQLLNVTLTSSFDAEDQAYDYTVTGDGVPGLIAAALTALAPVTGLTFRGETYMPTDGTVALPDPTIQAITTIPASTSSYTLGDGVYSHAPNSVPTYTLPDVEDATVVHTAKLTIKMSASVLTANFRDSAGDAISYEAPTGTISSGTLVEYVCTYEPLASGWAVSARVVMQSA